MSEKASNEVRLIEDWRERWEPVDEFGDKVLFCWESFPGVVYVASTTTGGIRCGTINNLIPKAKPKTIRPWKREEVPVGSVVRSGAGLPAAITHLNDSNESFIYVAGHGYLSPETMLKFYTQHTTNPDGTWVPTEQCPRCGVEE